MTTENESDNSRQRLLDQQRAIARAITRSEGLVSERVSKEFGIDLGQLQESHDTLTRKRVSQTIASLPMSAHVMGETFRTEFRAFAERNHFNEPNAIAEDAIAFAKEILKRPSLSPLLADCLNWELALHQWRLERFYWKRLKLRYDLIRWHRESAVHPIEANSTVCFWKCAGYGRIWF